MGERLGECVGERLGECVGERLSVRVGERLGVYVGEQLGELGFVVFRLRTAVLYRGIPRLDQNI